MSRIYIFASLVSLVIVLSLYPTIDSNYFKKLYKEFVSAKAWKKVDVVDEKRAFEGLLGGGAPWGMLELVVAATAACVISLLVGWRLNNYRKMQEKEADIISIEEKLMDKFSDLEISLIGMERKFLELQEKYALLNAEVNLSRDLLEKEVPLSKGPSQSETEWTDSCSQTLASVDDHREETLPDDTPNPALSPDIIQTLNLEEQNDKFAGDVNVTAVKVETDLPVHPQKSVVVEGAHLVIDEPYYYPLELDIVTGSGENKPGTHPQYKHPPPGRVTTPGRYGANNSNTENNRRKKQRNNK